MECLCLQCIHLAIVVMHAAASFPNTGASAVAQGEEHINYDGAVHWCHDLV